MVNFFQSLMNPQPPADDMSLDTLLAPRETITSRQIQEALGAVEPNSGGTVMDILSQRFQPTTGDPADALLATMMSGKFQTAQDRADARTNVYLRKMATLGSLQKLARTNAGGATGELVDRLRAENPKLSFGDALYQIQTGWRQNQRMNPDGSVGVIPGAPDVKRELKYAEQQGKNLSDVESASAKGFNTETGKGAGKTIIANEAAATALDMLDSSIVQADNLLDKVELTGPIAGRIGSAANDPDYANLQGALNGIVLQAKELYNLGSGQGFSDADREFLQDVVAGKYSRAETIRLALQRMSQISLKRRQFVSGQSARLAPYAGGQNIQPLPAQAPENLQPNDLNGWSIEPAE